MDLCKEGPNYLLGLSFFGAAWKARTVEGWSEEIADNSVLTGTLLDTELQVVQLQT